MNITNLLPSSGELKKTCWYNFSYSGKCVPTITKAYTNVLGAQARVWTTQKLFQSSSHPEKESCCTSEKFCYFKTKHISPQKLRVVQLQTKRKIRENIRNSVSNFYWWFVKDPYGKVFEADGSTCKKVN